MVKVDQSKRPPMLKRFARFGGYVPRIFILKSDGTLNTALTSGHPRYPYFYSSKTPQKLVAVMRRAL